ncbi:YfhO family protein [Ruminococcus sp.]|uniref:YfhO family protein n=1 Tax=Ruminococcus sp. TaxID=41978 RepID=UPI001B6CF164|nr:YfhO family protein [Ruminococcus sp.]MBP5432429.1 YfhO family protein [Ruminococcus sp.]
MKRSIVDLRCTKEKYLTAFITGFATMLFTMLPMMIAEHGYFIYYGDFNAQQIPFYCLVSSAVKTGQMGWNWLTDLGSDLMTSYSFYLFGSPFFWMIAFLPRSIMLRAIPVMLALKHGTAALTAYAYIRRFVRGKNAALTGALLYSFSGFQIFNIFFNHFQDVTALFPLMLIAMEECVNCRKKGHFALSVAVMACVNYYFFAGQAIFLIIYYLCRRKSPDFHISWHTFLGLCLEAVLGTLMSAFILLPSAMALIGNFRLNERLYGADMIAYTDTTLIPKIIQSFFMPCDPPGYSVLFSENCELWASIGGYMPLFSMAGVISFMHLRRKHWASKLTAVCIVFAFIPILNSLFQALNSYYYARWFYMPILIMAMMTAHTLDDESSDGLFGLKVSAFFLATFALIGCFPQKPEAEKKPKLFTLPEDVPYFWATVGVSAVLLLCCTLIFHRKKNGTLNTAFTVLATAAASVICVFTTTVYGADSAGAARKYISEYIDYENDVYEMPDKDNFFRIDTGYNTENASMIWGIPSVRAFHSVVSPSIMDFYGFVGITRDVSSRPTLQHYPLRSLLSVKYFYKEKKDGCSYEELLSSASAPRAKKAVSDSEEEDISEALIPDELIGFEYADETENFEIYENKLFIPLGWAYDTYITKSAAMKKSELNREIIMLRSIVLSEEQAEKYSDIMEELDPSRSSAMNRRTYELFCIQKQQCCSESFVYDSHGFRSVIELPKPQLVFFSVPYSKGWSAEINGRKADIERVNEGFMAVRAETGKNIIVFSYKTPYLTAGFMISLTATAALVLYVLICRRKGGSSKNFPFRHCYDYNSCQKLKTVLYHCDSLFSQKEDK